MEFNSINIAIITALGVAFIAVAVGLRIYQYNKSVVKCNAIAEAALKSALFEAGTHDQTPKSVFDPHDSLGKYLSSRCGLTGIEVIKGSGTYILIEFKWLYLGYVSKHAAVTTTSNELRLDTVGRILRKMDEVNSSTNWNY